MVEHAPGAEIERVSGVGLFRVGAVVDFPEFAPAARKIVGEEEGGAGMVEAGAGPVHAAFAVEAVVVDAVEVGGELAHFFPDFRRMAVVEAGGELHTEPLLLPVAPNRK